MKKSSLFYYLFFLVFLTKHAAASDVPDIDKSVNSFPGSVTAGPSVQGFVLVDPVTDQDIRSLKANDTLYTGIPYNIRVDALNAQSVRIQFGNTYNRVENQPPFSLAGDNNGDYASWYPSQGIYTLQATPYSEKFGKGTAGPSLSYRITVLPPPPVSFMLIDADTDKDLFILKEGTVIDLSKLPTSNLNIRADVNWTLTESVKFGLNSQPGFRIENQAPYSLFGDINGNYNAWTPSPGQYTLSATAYSQDKATGTQGPSATIHFSVIDQPQVYLVPASGHVTVSTCSGTVYDPGGPENYPNNADGSLTILPGTPGWKVKLDFTLYRVVDDLYIYDGPDTLSPLIGSFEGYNPGVVYATNPSGALTLRFVSDDFSTYTGFTAAISCTQQVAMPDLVVDHATLPADTIGAGATFWTSVILKNAGDNVAGPSVVAAYLSRDRQLGMDDILLREFNFIPMTPGYTFSNSQLITLPHVITYGTYYILYKADNNNQVRESNEANNIFAKELYIASPFVDLEIIADTTVPGTIYPGTYSLIRYSISNTGNTSLYTDVSVFLSQDTILNSSDIFLSKDSLIYVQANDTTDNEYYVSIPANVLPGNYYLLYYVDSNNEFSETNELNNVAVVRVTAIPAAPDLWVREVYAPTAVVQGDSAFIGYAIFNIGNAYAGPSESAIYLSTDQVLDSTDRLLGTGIDEGIPADDFIFSGATVLFPSDIPPGSYYILVDLDYKNTVAELNESNNLGYDYEILHVTAPIADLTIPSVFSYHDMFASPRDSIYFIYSTISNGIAAQAEVGFYLSTDSIWDNNYLLLEKDEAVDFFMFEYNTFWDKPLHIPGFVSPGNYYLIVVADPENLIPEGNELNNTGNIKLNIVPESFIIKVPVSGTIDVTTCSGVLTANEVTGRYKPGDGIVTIYPAVSGNNIRLDFQGLFFLNYSDTLYIFDGPDTTSSLLGKYNYPGPETVVASNPSGALTVRFDANDIYPNSYGFLAYISCVEDGAARSGLFTQAEDPGVLIYPNPTEGRFTLSMDAQKSGTGMASVFIYDNSGRLVAQDLQSKGKYESEIDLSEQPEGIYTVKVVTATSVSVRQLLVK